jgi:hypothetical protein
MRKALPAAVLAPAAALAFALALAPAAVAAGPPCRPCAGLAVSDPLAAAAALGGAPAVAADGRLYVAWGVELDADAAAVGGAAQALASAGATPWLRLAFHAPSPIAEHLDALEAELRRATELARGAGPATHFQVLWRPAGGGAAPAADYAFLFKRAAVALSGARPEARVITRPFPPDEAELRAFYGEQVSAYVDGIALAAGEPDRLDAAVALLAQLDPGRPVVVEGPPFPPEPGLALARAAELAREGAALSFFDLAQPTADELRPLVLLANEFGGDLSFDPYSVPTGGEAAWTFVRGKDLGLRVIAEAPPGSDELVLSFSDSQLKHPSRIDPATGEAIPLAGVRRTAAGLEVRVADPGRVSLLRLERATAAELEGVAEEIDITSQRQMPVEEILRRLQTFEDAQARKLDHYQATNTTHLRFQASAGSSSTFEATLEGDFFWRRDQGFDWAWQSFYVNGVRWRGKKLPEIPLIEPEKAAAPPLAIELSRRYVYRLAGTETVGGRDCWVVEFRPSEQSQGEAEKLFRGSVWIDRQLYARVQTRAVQLGLQGEVLSNEETVSFSPVDAAGGPGPWSGESYFLPTRTFSQQLLSVVNATLLVERQIELSAITVNGADFDQRRRAVLASDATMVHDTDRGLRYLVKEEGSDERVVKEGFDTNKLFAVGGVFYDDALAYPLPLAGINYFSFDFRGTGNQFNAFFAGALGTLSFAQPRVGGSRFDLGGNAFVLALPFSDTLYRGGRQAKAEEVKSQTANVSLLAGHPIGNFFKVEAQYELSYQRYKRAGDTAADFVLPADTLTHSFSLDLRYARSGYQLTLTGSYNRRADWGFWGLPGNGEFDPTQQDYQRWQARASKSWYLAHFRRFGAEVDYFGGADLDRFSKYQFGFFGGTRVHGYQSDKVRAEEGWAGHLSYGLVVGEAFRLEGVFDAAVATDQASGLKDELLGGAGVVGQFVGPWQTLVQVDLGVPVSGPDSGFVAYVVFLKLFG